MMVCLSLSAEDIYNHGAGSNPYRYPNLDFYSSDYLRKMNSRYEATAEISGGGKRAHFYSNINYYRQGDYFKFGEAKNNNTQRFSVRGNVDIDITDDIRLGSTPVQPSMILILQKGNYWEAAATWRPNFPQNAAPLFSTARGLDFPTYVRYASRLQIVLRICQQHSYLACTGISIPGFHSLSVSPQFCLYAVQEFQPVIHRLRLSTSP